MLECTDKKLHKSYAVLWALLILCVIRGSIGITMAHYRAADFTATVYGGEKADDFSTLGVEKKVYDWGDWSAESDEDPTATIILQESEPLNGVLQFSFDRTTVEARDVFLFADWGIPASGGSYTVRDEDGRVELPFSVLIADRLRSAQVVLDVTWTPNGADTPTLSARYLFTLYPQTLCGDRETSPAFGSATEFLTDRLLHLSVQTPATMSGVMLANGFTLSDSFAVGTRYYTKQYPQGVQLLNDSPIYISTDGSDVQEILLEWNHNDSSEPMRIAAGAADGYLATTVQTPAEKATSLQVATGELPLVGKTATWTLTLTEAPVFRDAAWNNSVQEGAQLLFTIERLVNGAFLPIEPSEDLTVSIVQTETGGTVTVGAPTGKQPAGTYQVRIEQTWNGYPLHAETIPFFVDYR